MLNDPFGSAVKRSHFSFCKLDPVVLLALGDIIEFSTATNVAISEGTALIHPVPMEELVLNLQYRLQKAPFEAYSDLNNATRYASLLYLKSLRRSSDLRWISARIADRLQATLSYIIPSGHPMPLLCWVCFMGLFASIPMSDHWRGFAKTLIDWYTCQRGQRPDWPSLKEELMQIAWIPTAHDGPAQMQWQLVETIFIPGR